MYQNQKKKVELCTKTFGLYQVSQRFQYSQIENIKTLLSKYRFFFFSHPQKFHHLLGCHATGINFSLIFF